MKSKSPIRTAPVLGCPRPFSQRPMSRWIRPWLATFLWVAIGSALSGSPTTAAGAVSPAGHWEGGIRLPGTELKVRVDLDPPKNDSWSGTIDIPVQAIRGFKLSPVDVKGASVSFAMPNIPGGPTFQGTLASDGNSITGDFKQSGQAFPFQLERKDKPSGSATSETPSRGVPGTGFAGVWQGSLRISVAELRLLLNLTNTTATGLTGTVISMDQGGAMIPIATAKATDAKGLRLELPMVDSVFEGGLNQDGSEIVGTWTQRGQGMPLVFKRREKAPVLGRPQDPVKPYPYEEREVTIANQAGGVQLAGTLTQPRILGRRPAVVLITGSGPQDRDEAIMGHRPFLVLADRLTRMGIAVLRCDDRGVGKSTGTFATSTHNDFVTDALACVAFLKEQPDIDASSIGLVGHSEGGLVAPIAAVRSTDIRFIVLLAGVGVPVQDLLVQQMTDIARGLGASPEVVEGNARLQREIFKLIRSESNDDVVREKARELLKSVGEKLPPEQQKAMGISPEAMEAQIATLMSPWFRELLAYDPRPTLGKVRCAVLALNGSKDIQVAAKPNLSAIQEALAAGGNLSVQTEEFPGLNHLFQHCQSGAVAEYGQIEETMAPAVMERVGKWILDRTGR